LLLQALARREGVDLKKQATIVYGAPPLLSEKALQGEIDATLTAAQRDMSHLINRMLDDLYWVMSYSRWKDEQFWPAFRDALLREHPSLTDAGLRKAQEAAITWMMERTLSKRRILEIYLNVAEWGEGIFGAEAAARHHFGVPAAALTPERAAFSWSTASWPRTTSPRASK